MGNKPWRPKGLTPPTADSDVVGRSPEEIYFAGVDDTVEAEKKAGLRSPNGWLFLIPDEGRR